MVVYVCVCRVRSPIGKTPKKTYAAVAAIVEEEEAPAEEVKEVLAPQEEVPVPEVKDQCEEPDEDEEAPPLVDVTDTLEAKPKGKASKSKGKGKGKGKGKSE